MKVFDYKIVEFSTSYINEVEEQLKNLGNDGWELVSIVNIDKNSGKYIFKKEKNKRFL
jgi:hypothetical protein